MKKTKIFCGILVVLTIITAIVTSCSDNPPIAELPDEPGVTLPEVPDETPSPVETQPEITEPEVTEPAETEPPETPEQPEVPPASADLAAVLEAANDSLNSGEEAGDSSYWIMNCFLRGGVSLPRSIKEQAQYGAEIDFAAAEPGDLIFFTNDETGEPHFGGIYTGDGMMIYSTGTELKTADITTKYWNEHFVTARRV